MAEKNLGGILPVLVVVTVFLAAGIVSADTIYLKNGGRIKGAVVKDDGPAVTIDIGAGTVVHNKKDIARVVAEKIPHPGMFSGVNYPAKSAGEASVTKAPKPKAKLIEVFDMMMEGVKSILRFDFLKRSK